MTRNSKKAPAGDSVQSPDQLQDSAANGAAATSAIDKALARATRGGIIRSDVAIDQLKECPWNPRTGYDKAKLGELAESIRQVGLLEPLVVRPRPGKSDEFEIVCGHRRFRAAKLAGLAEVPVEIRELDDETVLEIQLVENVQRADLSPIDEAKGFRRMIDVHKLTADEVADRVAISRSSVYERLRLLDLPEKAAKAVIEGRLPASTAGLLVRIQDPTARKAAADAILAGDRERHVDGDGKKGPPEPLSFRAARALVREEFLLELKGAPFSQADVDLVPEAGSCTTCPKRTGNMKEAGEVLGEVRPDVCTDGACFKLKLEAIWVRRSGHHEAAGGKVLSEAQSKKLFNRYGRGDHVLAHGTGYVDLDEKPYEFEMGLQGTRTWRSVLKGSDVETVLARSPSGLIFEIVDKKDAEKVARAKAPKRKTAASSSNDGWKKRQAAAAKKAREERAQARALLESFRAVPISDWPKDAKSGTKIIRFLGQVLEWECLSDPLIELGKLDEEGKSARGEGWKRQETARKALRTRLESESGSEALLAACELGLASALMNERTGYQGGPGGKARAKDVVDGLLKVAGLDRKKAQAAAAKLAAEKTAAKADATPKVAKKARKAARRAS